MKTMTPYMSKTLLDMMQMEKADLIRYYTLPDGTKGLLVISDGNSVNLCEYDDEWMMLIKKVDSLYRISPDACMDEYTEEILRGRLELGSMDRFAYLGEAARYNDKAITYSRAAFSQELVTYFLGKIYEDIGIELKIREIKGSRSRFIISCKVDDEEKNIPFSFTEEDGGYRYRFGNIFSAADTAEIFLKYEAGSIYVSTESSTSRELRHDHSYSLFECSCEQRIIADGQIVFSDTQKEEMQRAQLTDTERYICGVEDDSFTGYILPWGERIFVKGDEHSREMIADNSSGMIIQIYSEKMSDGIWGEIKAVHEIFSQDDRMLIQTGISGEVKVKNLGDEHGGYYYRYINGSETAEIKDEFRGMTCAQITEKYLTKTE